MRHYEKHRAHRVGWLRASVLGANDGIVSTASLVLGVAAAGTGKAEVLTAGVAGLVAGAMSMAAGEYVSVSSQKDTEEADLETERLELAEDPLHEHAELTEIYIERGVDAATASRVAQQMMDHDALAAHARDELGISDVHSARPAEAAWASAAAFSIGASLPLAITALLDTPFLLAGVAGTSLGFLALLGVLAARTGGARTLVGATRVTAWGAAAMALTTVVGRLFGAAI